MPRVLARGLRTDLQSDEEHLLSQGHCTGPGVRRGAGAGEVLGSMLDTVSLSALACQVGHVGAM